VFGGCYFDGMIADVVVDDRALLASEVSGIHTSRLVGPNAGPSTPTPEPASIALHGVGLLATGGVARRRRARA
jgi:hypothetical protein